MLQPFHLKVILTTGTCVAVAPSIVVTVVARVLLFGSNCARSSLTASSPWRGSYY